MGPAIAQGSAISPGYLSTLTPDELIAVKNSPSSKIAPDMVQGQLDLKKNGNTVDTMRGIENKYPGDLGSQIKALEEAVTQGPDKIDQDWVNQHLAALRQQLDQEIGGAYKSGVSKTSGGVVGGAVEGVKKIFSSDARTKRNIKSIPSKDIDELLDSVNLVEYNYKPEHIHEASDEGRKIGFLMQDIDKTKLGKVISREKDGMKAYDPQSLQTILLAALKQKREEKSNG